MSICFKKVYFAETGELFPVPKKEKGVMALVNQTVISAMLIYCVENRQPVQLIDVEWGRQELDETGKWLGMKSKLLRRDYDTVMYLAYPDFSLRVVPFPRRVCVPNESQVQSLLKYVKTKFPQFGTNVTDVVKNSILQTKIKHRKIVQEIYQTQKNCIPTK